MKDAVQLLKQQYSTFNIDSEMIEKLTKFNDLDFIERLDVLDAKNESRFGDLKSRMWQVEEVLRKKQLDDKVISELEAKINVLNSQFNMINEQQIKAVNSKEVEKIIKEKISKMNTTTSNNKEMYDIKSDVSRIKGELQRIYIDVYNVSDLQTAMDNSTKRLDEINREVLNINNKVKAGFEGKNINIEEATNNLNRKITSLSNTQMEINDSIRKISKLYVDVKKIKKMIETESRGISFQEILE